MSFASLALRCPSRSQEGDAGLPFILRQTRRELTHDCARPHRNIETVCARFIDFDASAFRFKDRSDSHRRFARPCRIRQIFNEPLQTVPKALC